MSFVSRQRNRKDAHILIHWKHFNLAAKKSLYEITRGPKVAAIASQQTVYRWISMGITTAAKADLPMVARYKKRKAKSYDYDGSSKGKNGRNCLDYLAHRRSNPGEFGCQMDFLGSPVTDRKAMLHGILTSAGLKSTKRHKAKKRKARHPARPRRKDFGELLQIDASIHSWFGDSLPKATLHEAIC